MPHHQLFPPPDDGQEHPELEFDNITLARFENGGVVWCPTKFDPTTLKDAETLYGLLGGGTYELSARKANGQIAKKQKITLPGSPKPLVPDTAPKTSATAAPATLMAGGASGDIVSLLITMMMNQQNQQVQMMQNANQQTIAMFTTMLAMSKSEGASSQAATMKMVELMAGIAQKPGGDAAATIDKAMELFTTGVEFQRQAALQAAPVPTEPKSELEQFFQGAAAVLAATTPANQSPPGLASVPPPAQRRSSPPPPNGVAHASAPSPVSGPSGESQVA